MEICSPVVPFNPLHLCKAVVTSEVKSTYQLSKIIDLHGKKRERKDQAFKGKENQNHHNKTVISQASKIFQQRIGTTTLQASMPPRIEVYGTKGSDNK